MAKKINEKITNTHKLSVEGTFDLDKLVDGTIMAEVEDEEKPVDIGKILKKFNGQYAQLTMTVKTESLPEE